MATKTIAEFASIIDTTPREARKFLREVAPDNAPGKGGRWAIEAREVRSLRSKFAKWSEERTPQVDDASDAPELDDAPDAELDA